MPIFALELNTAKLKSGAADAVRVLDKVSQTAGDAQRSVSGIGNAGKRAAKDINLIDRAMAEAEGKVKSLAAGVLGLVGAYKAVSAAVAFLQRGWEFTSSMETASIGMASILSTMADIRDAEGNVLEGQDKYNAALDISAKLMERIQILGLQTTATSQELVQGVQSVIAPALQAGIAVEKIPDFAVQAAQAMQAMSIPLQQMRTEVEALLTGNINKAQDLLAPRLGIDKETINSWKEQGVLAEKLQARLSMFKYAGDDVAKTFQGIKSNVAEAMDFVSGKISGEFTESVKEAMTAFQNLLVSTNGKIGISEDFENINRVLQDATDLLGEKLLEGVKSLIEGAKELNASLANTDAKSSLGELWQMLKEVGAALAGATVAYKAFGKVRAAANTETVATLRNEAQAVGLQQSLRDRILKTNEALYQKIQAERQAAQAALTTAKQEKELITAQERRTASLVSGLSRTQNQARAEQELALVRQRLVVATNNVAAAEVRLAAAAKGSTELKTAWTGLKSAGAGLIGLLGGPWGAVLTTAGLAAGYLATKETDAEQAARAHEKALRALQMATKGTTGAQEEYLGVLDSVKRAQLDVYRDSAFDAMKSQIKSISEELNKVKVSGASRWMQMATPVDGPWLTVGNEDINGLLKMLDGVKQGTVSAEEFQQSLGKIRDRMTETGDTGSKLYAVLTNLLVEPTEELKKYAATYIEAKYNMRVFEEMIKIVNASLGIASDSTNGMARAVGNLNDAVNAFDPKRLQSVKEGLEFEAYTNTLSDKQKKEAQALRSAGTSLGNIKFMQSGLAGPVPQELREIQTLAGDAYKPSKSASSGVNQVENARRSLETLRAEIDKLNGSGSAADVTLTKKFNEIDKVGASAKLSAGEIAKLKQEYGSAFQADTLKDFNKEILQLEDNTTALRDLEIDEQVKKWTAQFEAAKVPAEEAAAYIERLKTAFAKQSDIKDVQTFASFYKDLAEKSGQFDVGLEYQNRLIEQQAVAWKAAGIPMSDILRMQELLRLEAARDPYSGILRAARSYYSESTDLAKQFESITGNAFSGMEDALVQFTQTGKLSFSDMINSMISDLARLMIRQSITGPLAQGIAGLFGGASGAASGFSDAFLSGNDTALSVWGFHNGGVVGSGTPSFSRSVPFAAFSDASRFHSGYPGFGRDEYPAILQTGERVLNRDETAAYNAGQYGSGLPWHGERTAQSSVVSAPVAVNIQVINQTGTEAKAETTQQRNSQGGMDVIVLLKKEVAGDIARGGVIDQTIRGRYGVSPLVRGR